jgi:hypothetical protein
MEPQRNAGKARRLGLQSPIPDFAEPVLRLAEGKTRGLHPGYGTSMVRVEFIMTLDTRIFAYSPPVW